MNVFELVAKLTLDDTEYQDKLKDAANDGKSMGTKFKKTLGTVATAAKVGVVAAATATVAVGKKALEQYSEFEQLAGGAELMFGEAYNTVAQNADQAYKTVQMSQNAYLQEVNGYATGLKMSLEGNEQAAADLAHRIVVAEADIVAATGRSQDAVQNAFAGVMRGNFTMLDNLGIGIKGSKEGMEEVINKVNEWNAAQGKATDYQMDNYADMQSALIDYVDMVGMAGYAQMEAAGTIQGSNSMMQASWQNLLTAMASGQMDVGEKTQQVIDSVKQYVENVVPIVKNFIESIPEVFSTVGENIKSFAVTKFEEAREALKNFDWKEAGTKIINDVIGQISGIVNNVRDWFTNAKDAIDEIDWEQKGRDIIDWIGNAFTNIADTFMSWFSTGKDGIESVDWAGAGTAILGFIESAWGALKSWATGLWNQAKEGISSVNWKQVGETVKTKVSEAWDALKKWAKEKWDKAVDGISSVDWKRAGETVKTWIGATWSTLREWAGKLWEKAKTGIQSVNWAEVGDKVKTAVGAAWSTLREWASKLWEKAKTGIQSVNWAEIGGKVKDAISTAWNALTGWATGIWNSAKAGIEAVNWGEAGNAVLQWFGAAWSQLKTWAQGWWENAKAGIESVDWEDVGNTIWENIKTGVGSLVDNMKKLFETGATGIKNVDWETLGSDIWDLIKSGLEALGAGFVSLFTGAKDDVGDGKTIDWAGLGESILNFIFEGMKGIGGMILGLFEAAWEDIQKIPWADLGLVIANWILDGMGGLGDWIRDKLDIARVSIEDLDWSGTGKEAASQVVDGMSDLPGDVTELGERAANGFGGGRGGGGGGTAGGGDGRGNVWTRTADTIRGFLRDGISHITTDISSTADKAASNFGGASGGGGSAGRWSGAGRNAGSSVANAFNSAVLKALDSVNTLQQAINNMKGKTLTINIKNVVTNTSGGDDYTKPNRRASAMDTGYIFRHPTVFGYYNGKPQMAGDVGAEAVVGVYSLDKMIQNSVNAAVGRTQAAMVGVLSEILDKMPKGQLVLDTGALVGGIAPEMNNELERITAWSGGGRA